MPEDQQMMIEPTQEQISANKRIRQIGWLVVVLLVLFFAGLGSSYLQWGRDDIAVLEPDDAVGALYEQINPQDGYTLPVSYGDLGPQLLEGGVIDYDAFAAIYTNSGNPLTPEQITILKQGSEAEIVIDARNAHFLLNFFWAVGLANRNSILTEGAMVQHGGGQIASFASTGGWGLATKPVTELYASLDLIPLNAEQQSIVEEVAGQIYRPCCNNHTAFPDCNHGMAMLGILELMASQGASADEMFEAAKYINAHWFPQQTLETALYLQFHENLDFASADGRLVVGESYSSASGAAMVHQDLQSRGVLPAAPGSGGSCSN